ncbi:MAG: GAF domain-containing protein [Lachnospiraceae bacterium]|nr:GAF domain-containing protein [Lachnospiraceae bacterium]
MTKNDTKTGTPADSYLKEAVLSLAEEDPWYVPLFSNVSALIMENMKDLNWAGFYVVRDGELVLGPFLGKSACIHIRYGKGVCGTAWKEDRTVRVENVHDFPGHIACDSASNSEIVLPIRKGNEIKAVLDIDSPVFGRFSEADESMLQRIADVLSEVVHF